MVRYCVLPLQPASSRHSGLLHTACESNPSSLACCRLRTQQSAGAAAAAAQQRQLGVHGQEAAWEGRSLRRGWPVKYRCRVWPPQLNVHSSFFQHGTPPLPGAVKYTLQVGRAQAGHQYFLLFPCTSMQCSREHKMRAFADLTSRWAVVGHNVQKTVHGVRVQYVWEIEFVAVFLSKAAAKSSLGALMRLRNGAKSCEMAV